MGDWNYDPYWFKQYIFQKRKKLKGWMKNKRKKKRR